MFIDGSISITLGFLQSFIILKDVAAGWKIQFATLVNSFPNSPMVPDPRLQLEWVLLSGDEMLHGSACICALVFANTT